MTHKQELRRLRRRAALAFFLALAFLLGYLAGAKANSTEVVYVQLDPVVAVPDLPILTPPPVETKADEPAATNYSSLNGLKNLGTFTATAYCPCIKCCGSWSAEHPNRGEDYVQRTASGTTPTAGRTIAADWGVLPAGTEVVIRGHTYTVEDTGAAIKGNRVDIFFGDHNAALEWGVQEVDIYTEAENG